MMIIRAGSSASTVASESCSEQIWNISPTSLSYRYQIQILLRLLLLLHPLPPTTSSPKELPKKRKKQKRERELLPEDIEYTLSNLLYGLSSLAEFGWDGTRNDEADEEGWLSLFCEQVVAPM